MHNVTVFGTSICWRVFRLAKVPSPLPRVIMACSSASANTTHARSPTRASTLARTPSPPRRSTSMGARHQAQRPRSDLEMAVKRNDVNAVRAILQADDGCALLPASDGNSILHLAVRSHCSLACWTALLDAGAPVRALNAQMQTPLDALIAMPVPELYLWDEHGPVATGRGRPDAQRRNVEMAIELLKRGAEPSADIEEAGAWNQNCLRCTREYKDTLAAEVWQRWARRGLRSECLCQVGAYLACRY